MRITRIDKPYNQSQALLAVEGMFIKSYIILSYLNVGGRGRGGGVIDTSKQQSDFSAFCIKPPQKLKLTASLKPNQYALVYNLWPPFNFL